MPQFCILFYANYTILATQKGGHGTMPPLKYAPAYRDSEIRMLSEKHVAVSMLSEKNEVIKFGPKNVII